MGMSLFARVIIWKFQNTSLISFDWISHKRLVKGVGVIKLHDEAFSVCTALQVFVLYRRLEKVNLAVTQKLKSKKLFGFWGQFWVKMSTSFTDLKILHRQLKKTIKLLFSPEKGRRQTDMTHLKFDQWREFDVGTLQASTSFREMAFTLERNASWAESWNFWQQPKTMKTCIE